MMLKTFFNKIRNKLFLNAIRSIVSEKQDSLNEAILSIKSEIQTLSRNVNIQNEIAKISSQIASNENIMRDIIAKIHDLELLLHDTQDTVHTLKEISDKTKNELHLSTFYNEQYFYALFKQSKESDIAAKKRFFAILPAATGGLRLLQKANSFLLEQFDKICCKYSIPYWLGGGTLIGAFRHGGSIPWDDDADVVMLRTDLEKLMEVINNEKDYKITIVFDFFAVCRQVRFRSNDEQYPFFIDIFIYDAYSEQFSYNPETENHKKMMEFVYSSDLPSVLYWKEHPFIDKNDENFSKIDRLFSQYSLRNEAIRESSLMNQNTCLLRASDNCNAPKNAQTFFSWNSIFPLKKLVFEDHEYPVPNDTEYFLNQIYGNIFAFPKDVFSHFSHYDKSKISSFEFKKLVFEFMKTKL